jgi:hypothetical protein
VIYKLYPIREVINIIEKLFNPNEALKDCLLQQNKIKTNIYDIYEKVGTRRMRVIG